MNEAESISITEALAALGATPDLLSDDDRAALDRDGYLLIPDVLTPAQVAELARRVDLLGALEGDNAGKELHQEAGTARLSNLVDKGDVFRLCFTHPRVLAAVAHVLRGDLMLSALNARAALPGQGLQGMHVDWSGPVAADDYRVCNSIWPLDDFTPENGATRAVPGSHRTGLTPGKVMADVKSPHPEEQLLLPRAGSVVVFNSHTWHGGTLNQTAQPRRALFAYFARRDGVQQTPQQDYLSPVVVRSLSPAERSIVNVS